jgi:hypothetical protein
MAAGVGFLFPVPINHWTAGPPVPLLHAAASEEAFYGGLLAEQLLGGMFLVYFFAVQSCHGKTCGATHRITNYSWCSHVFQCGSHSVSSGMREYYKDYWRILTAVINQAKRMTYEKQIRDSSNKIWTTWNIIHRQVCKKVNKENIQTLCIEGKNTTDLNTIVEAFSNYYNRIADSIHNQIKERGANRNNISSYLKITWLIVYVICYWQSISENEN